MKVYSGIRRLIVAAVLLAGTTVQATAVQDGGSMFERIKALVAPVDTVEVDRVSLDKMSQKEYEQYLLTAPVDTTRRDSVTTGFSVKVLARAKGDRVLLRWAPDEFAPWYLANKHGYNILRMGKEGKIDTLQKALKPYTIEQLQARFEPTDSLAGAAAQMLYGKGTELNEAIGIDGAEGIMQVYEEQQTRYAYAMLLAEVRPDLAEAMAMMYVDKTAVKGAEYTYMITTNIPEKELNMSYQPVIVKNVKEKPLPYEPVITDSMGVDGRSIRLFWSRTPQFGTYDIERLGENGEWIKLNERRFMTLFTQEDEATVQNIFEDVDLEPGTYSYRICGYDTFGEKSEYSAVHTAQLHDVIPPTAPVIVQFNVERPDENTIMADVIWEKNIIEPDFLGYNVYYYNAQVDSVWVKLNEQLLDPKMQSFRCEVSFLGTGHVTVVALDTANNSSAAMPQELFIADFTPPAAPTGLQYVMSPTGSVMIKWDKNPEPDVAGYHLYYANDSTHTFLQKSGKMTRTPVIFDTLQVTNITQRYTYYRVKAYDYSGNESAFSSVLAVKRKNYDPPRPCRIDSVWQDTKRVYMTWFPSSEEDVEKFYVYRRVHGEEYNTLINVLTKDSVKNGRLLVVDSPEPNNKKRYYYHIETMNETGVTSEPSYETSFLFKGETVLPLTLRVGAAYRNDDELVHIAWDIEGITRQMLEKRLYICLYRRYNDDDIFRYVRSLDINETNITDSHLEPGDKAEYRIRVRSREGHVSPYSNVVEVVVPQESESGK